MAANDFGGFGSLVVRVGFRNIDAPGSLRAGAFAKSTFAGAPTARIRLAITGELTPFFA